MNSRERVKLALDHKEPDRVPFDLSATYVTGIHKDAYHRWRQALGLPKVEPQIFEMLQQLAMVADDMLDTLGVDVKPVTPGGPDVTSGASGAGSTSKARSTRRNPRPGTSPSSTAASTGG